MVGLYWQRFVNKQRIRHRVHYHLIAGLPTIWQYYFMQGLFILFALFAAISALIMPWVALARINRLEDELIKLRKILGALTRGETRSAPTAATTASVTEPSISAKPTPTESKPVAPEPPADSTPQRAEPEPDTPKPSFEERFGARMPVWIGGIALALGGLYLVKYSIDAGWLSPMNRVILGLLLGLGLQWGAAQCRKRPDMANGRRIGQALAGAGIVVLYVAIFAAASLYSLIAPWLGFLGMGVVTAAALVQSLKFGAPIALIGLLGGFLTPALISSNQPDVMMLLLYVYIVFSGLMVVIRKERWWMLSLPTMLGAFAWVALWLGTSFTPDDTIWLGLFLVAVSATTVITSHREFIEGEKAVTLKGHLRPTAILNYISLATALLFTGILAAEGGFGMMQWVLFLILSLGAVGLAWFDDRHYGFAPWAAMAVNLIMLFVWEPHDANIARWGFYAVLFGALFAGLGYRLMWKARLPLLWAGLCGFALIGYYLLAAYRLYDVETIGNIYLFWGWVGLALAAFAAYTVTTLQRAMRPGKTQDYCIALFALVCTALLTLALALEMRYEFLSLAVALEMLAVMWIYHRLLLPGLPHIAIALAVVFGFLLLPQWLLAGQLALKGLFDQTVRLPVDLPVMQWPLVQLAIPAGCFIATARLFERHRLIPRFMKVADIIAIVLLTLAGYYLMRTFFLTGNADPLYFKPSFWQRGLVTTGCFLAGLLCVWIAQKRQASHIGVTGMVLCAVALFRVVYFDIVISNPLIIWHQIHGVPLFNTLTLVYMVPFALTLLLERMINLEHFPKWHKALHIAQFLILFAFITLSVRQVFDDNNVLAHQPGQASNLEMYSYSVVWLLFGIGLLFAGIYKQSRSIRYASMGVMLLAIGKVFLYDASELEGLLRVASFLGLGASLIGLSWVYSKYVLVSHAKAD